MNNPPFQLVELIMKDFDIIHKFAIQLNPSIEPELLASRIGEMLRYENYHLFGLQHENEIKGISGAWILTRFYSGKQLEIDNFIIDEKYRGNGYGKTLFDLIEDWARQQNCLTVELNTYVHNAGSHKFYFNRGMKILGYHFDKKL